MLLDGKTGRKMQYLDYAVDDGNLTALNEMKKEKNIRNNL